MFVAARRIRGFTGVGIFLFNRLGSEDKLLCRKLHLESHRAPERVNSGPKEARPQALIREPAKIGIICPVVLETFTREFTEYLKMELTYRIRVLVRSTPYNKLETEILPYPEE